ncbi:MAG: molybdopterin-dependent oxidoreductase, partial [Caldilineaceae bacterium]|nr:molybdopterin-dependent oxidoreductase [Caldilineaceae bacterium]
MRAVGSTLSRVDVVDKVAGVAQYPGDIDLPGQLWMKVVFAGIPHAQINTLNVDHARAAPGVVAVLTAADVPVNEYGLIIPDQPVLCGPGSTPTAAHVRWEADQIALVVAETKAQAEAAAQLIKVDYTPLPVITDPLAALAPDAPRIHANLPDNILHSYRIRRGHVESAFAQADVIVESKYRTHAQEHAYLQPEAGLAFVRDDGRIEVIIAGQWMHEDRQQIAHALGLPEEQIVVRYPAIGG